MDENSSDKPAVLRDRAVVDSVAARAETIWRRLWRRLTEDELLTRAAALSFYFIFALFPMALSLLAVLGMLAQSPTMHLELVRQVGRLMPSSARSLVQATLGELTVYTSAWKVAVGLALALWSGSGGMSCIMDALDRSRGTSNSRSWWAQKILALGLTTVISALSVIALVIVVVGGNLANFIGERTGLSHATILLWQIAEWPIALILHFVLAGSGLLVGSECAQEMEMVYSRFFDRGQCVDSGVRGIPVLCP